MTNLIKDNRINMDKIITTRPEIKEHNDHVEIKYQCGFGTISFISPQYSKQDEYQIKLFLDVVLSALSRENIANQLQKHPYNTKTTCLIYKDYCFEIKFSAAIVLYILNKYWCPNGHYYNKYLTRCSC
jgi:hypothetical protein